QSGMRAEFTRARCSIRPPGPVTQGAPPLAPDGPHKGDHSMDALFEQLRSAVDRLSGLTQALGDTAATVGHDPLPLVSADRIDHAFTSVAGAARLEPLELRPEAPRRPGSPTVPRPGVRHRLVVDSRAADAVWAAAGR